MDERVHSVLKGLITVHSCTSQHFAINYIKKYLHQASILHAQKNTTITTENSSKYKQGPIRDPEINRELDRASAQGK